MAAWNHPDDINPGSAAAPASIEPPPRTFAPLMAQALPTEDRAAWPTDTFLVNARDATADLTPATEGCDKGPGETPADVCAVPPPARCEAVTVAGVMGARCRGRYGPESNGCCGPWACRGSHRIVRLIPSEPASTA